MSSDRRVGSSGEACAIASAPGKVILFGEHAVVHGVTAVAAALSDLRIVAQVETQPKVELRVHLHDLLPTESGSAEENNGVIISYDSIRDAVKMGGDPFTPQVPGKEQIAALKSLFAKHEATTAQGLAAICYLVARILPEFIYGTRSSSNGLHIDVRSLGLPVGAGLGSSAAFSVATVGALLRLRHILFHDLGDLAGAFDEAEVLAAAPSRSDPVGGCAAPPQLLHVLNEWSFCSEVIIHGEPSGLDNTTSCYGGAVKLNKTVGKFEKLSPLPSGVGILLTNTRVPRSTKDLVAKVRRLKEDLPDVVRPLLDAVESISQEFLSMLSAASISAPGNESVSGFITKMSALCDVNHYILCALGVGHPALTSVWEASKRHGMACKLTGAGGGGCAFTVLPPASPNADTEVAGLQLELSNLGFESFTSNAGGLGAKWHSQYPELRKIQPSASSQKIREHKQESNHGDSIAVLKSRLVPRLIFAAACGITSYFATGARADFASFFATAAWGLGGYSNK